MKTYTEEQVKEMTEKIKQETFNNQMLQFAQQLQSSIANNYVISQKKNLFSNKFTQENVQKYLENPQKYEKELRQLSMVLTTISPQYQQIVNYFASICKYVPVVVPNLDKFSNAKGDISDAEKIKKDYLKISSHIEMMNIAHEFQRITEIATRDDIFYGYVHETKDSFYIQQMDSDYCRISTISDGVYNFAFDFGYFDSNNKIKGIDGLLIDSYPEEFQTKYKLYLNDKANMKWQELDEENTICIKFLEGVPFIFPPYASLFNDLSDLTQYKELTKTKTQVDNYKFIGMELPINNKGDKEDDFLVSTNTAMAFYQMLLNNLPEGIGAFLSATPFKDINFGSGAVTDKDNVNRAEDNVFTSSGVSPINFGKGASNSGTVKMSNMVDEARIFKLYRQFERWLNRRFKKLYNNKFIIKLLNVSVFNLSDTIDQNLKLAQYGVPNKLMLSALAGLSQSNERGLTFLEDNILNLSEEWKPLVSSHTQSSGNLSSGSGRPESDVTDLSESGEQTQNNDSNANR